MQDVKHYLWLGKIKTDKKIGNNINLIGKHSLHKQVKLSQRI